MGSQNTRIHYLSVLLTISIIISIIMVMSAILHFIPLQMINITVSVILCMMFLFIVIATIIIFYVFVLEDILSLLCRYIRSPIIKLYLFIRSRLEKNNLR